MRRDIPGRPRPPGRPEVPLRKKADEALHLELLLGDFSPFQLPPEGLVDIPVLVQNALVEEKAVGPEDLPEGLPFCPAEVEQGLVGIQKINWRTVSWPPSHQAHEAGADDPQDHQHHQDQTDDPTVFFFRLRIKLPRFHRHV